MKGKNFERENTHRDVGSEKKDEPIPPKGENPMTAATKKGDFGEEKGKEQKEVVTVNKKEYEQLKQQVSEYKDKYIRLCAEFENARKRMERDKIEFIKYANEGLLKEFLDILDNLERSVEAAKTKHEDYAAFLKGVEIVMAHIYEMLRKHDVKPIEAKGKKFDPHLHEPLMQEPSEEEEGTVLEEYQKGYLYGDRVIRTSKVKLAAPKIKGNEAPSETSEEISASEGQEEKEGKEEK